MTVYSSAALKLGVSSGTDDYPDAGIISVYVTQVGFAYTTSVMNGYKASLAAGYSIQFSFSTNDATTFISDEIVPRTATGNAWISTAVGVLNTLANYADSLGNGTFVAGCIYSEAQAKVNNAAKAHITGASVDPTVISQAYKIWIDAVLAGAPKATPTIWLVGYDGPASFETKLFTSIPASTYGSSIVVSTDPYANHSATTSLAATVTSDLDWIYAKGFKYGAISETGMNTAAMDNGVAPTEAQLAAFYTKMGPNLRTVESGIQSTYGSTCRLLWMVFFNSNGGTANYPHILDPSVHPQAAAALTASLQAAAPGNVVTADVAAVRTATVQAAIQITSAPTVVTPTALCSYASTTSIAIGAAGTQAVGRVVPAGTVVAVSVVGGNATQTYAIADSQGNTWQASTPVAVTTGASAVTQIFCTTLTTAWAATDTISVTRNGSAGGLAFVADVLANASGTMSTAVSASGSTNAPAAGALTANPQDLVYMATSGAATGVLSSVATGFTAGQTAASTSPSAARSVFTIYESAASAGSYGPAGTFSSAQAWAAVGVVFTAAADEYLDIAAVRTATVRATMTVAHPIGLADVTTNLEVDADLGIAHPADVVVVEGVGLTGAVGLARRMSVSAPTTVMLSASVAVTHPADVAVTEAVGLSGTLLRSTLADTAVAGLASLSAGMAAGRTGAAPVGQAVALSAGMAAGRTALGPVSQSLALSADLGIVSAPVYATIAYVGAGTPGVNTAASTTLAVPYPTGIAAGDYAVILFASNSTGVSSPPAGWTVQASVNAGTATPTVRAICGYLAGTETGSLTLTTPSAASKATMLVFRGVDQTTPVDVTPTSVGSSTAGTLWDVPSQTPVTAGAALVGVAANQGTPAGWTPPTTPSAWTEVWDVTSSSVPSADGAYLLNVPASPTGVMEFTAPSSQRGAAFVLALRPATLGATSTSVAATAAITGSATAGFALSATLSPAVAVTAVMGVVGAGASSSVTEAAALVASANIGHPGDSGVVEATALTAGATVGHPADVAQVEAVALTADASIGFSRGAAEAVTTSITATLGFGIQPSAGLALGTTLTAVLGVSGAAEVQILFVALANAYTRGPHMDLDRRGRENYRLIISTTAAVAVWEASFDGGLTYVPGDALGQIVAHNGQTGTGFGWLLAGDLADPADADAIITQSAVVKIRTVIGDEVIVRRAPQVNLVN